MEYCDCSSILQAFSKRVFKRYTEGEQLYSLENWFSRELRDIFDTAHRSARVMFSA